MHAVANDLTSFLLGVLSSIVAAYIGWVATLTLRREKLRKLEGYLIEDVHGPEGIVLISRFYFNRSRGRFVYEGTNFFPDGNFEWEYRSTAIIPEMKEEKVFYIYKAWKISAPAEEHYGFGYMCFEDDSSSRSIGWTTGYYRGSLPQHRSHGRTIHNARNICTELKLDYGKLGQREYQQELVALFRKRYTPNSGTVQRLETS